jgi:hypothetical protein
MANRYVIDLDGCYCQINRVTKNLPGVGMAIISSYELVKQAMRIVIGHQPIRETKATTLFNILLDLGIPTDYALEAVDRIVDVVETHIKTCTRIRLHYSEHSYEFINQTVLVIYEAMALTTPPLHTNQFWLDNIDEYYVGAELNDPYRFNYRS